MCYRVDCKTCGKYTWGGCGDHLTTLYASIDEGMHCTCRSWPGVVTRTRTTTTQQPTQSNNPNQDSRLHVGIGILKINEAALDSDTQQFFSGYMTRRGIEIGTVGVLVYVKSVKGVDINNVM
ncbi:hypothetical protein HKD37_11G030634 [Glycine soja]|nr:hypothetical protein GmHk_11G031206 [Glycine max]